MRTRQVQVTWAQISIQRRRHHLDMAYRDYAGRCGTAE